MSLLLLHCLKETTVWTKTVGLFSHNTIWFVGVWVSNPSNTSVHISTHCTRMIHTFVIMLLELPEIALHYSTHANKSRIFPTCSSAGVVTSRNFPLVYIPFLLQHCKAPERMWESLLWCLELPLTVSLWECFGKGSPAFSLSYNWSGYF